MTQPFLLKYGLIIIIYINKFVNNTNHITIIQIINTYIYLKKWQIIYFPLIADFGTRIGQGVIGIANDTAIFV